MHHATSTPRAHDASRDHDASHGLTADRELGDHIDFIRRILAGAAIPDAARAGHLARCAAIEARLRDPRLSLALIGEFSAGKSTLINALLRRNLLKSSLAVTTASVTRLQRGDTFRIDAAFRDGSTLSVGEHDAARLRDRLAPWTLAPSRNADLKELLDHLTANPVVACHVAQVSVTLPSDCLPENLVILDTPGISPGARDAAEHRALTQRVMNDIADAALVLVPSFGPMSQTLTSFLDAAAQPFLHRCMFLVTALDQVDPADRPDLLAYVTAELRNRLGLAEPVVLGASAIAMLPAPARSDPLGADRAHWQAQFRTVEHTVTSTLARHRSVILAETTTRLLHDLLGSLRDELARRQTTLADEAQRLAQSSLAAIDAVPAPLIDHCQSQIEERRRALATNAHTQRTVYAARAKQAAFDALDALGWSISNSERVEASVQHAAQVQGHAYLDNVNTALGGLRTCCEQLSREFASQFEASYRALPSLRTDVAVPAIAITTMPPPALAFGSLREYIADQNRQDSRGAGGGAAAGATLGMIGGPGGAVIGALIGGLVGLLQAGDSLEQRQSQLRRYAGAEIDSYVERYRAAADAHIDRIAGDCVRQFRAAAAAHKAQYGERIAALIEQHEARSGALRRTAADIADCAAEVDRRIRRLAALAATLSNL